MRVALDCRTITAHKTGDRTYALQLANALARRAPPESLTWYTWEPAGDLLPGPPAGLEVVLAASPRWLWTPLLFPRDLARRGIEVAHVQYLVPPRAPCPVITTIHDIAFRRFPHLFPLKHRLLLNTLIPFAVRQAALVLTGSESTRRDLVELMGARPERVVVTPYAAGREYRSGPKEAARERVIEALDIQQPYILSVGVRQPRKNLARLVRAYGRIAGDVPYRLVIVGREGWAESGMQQAVAEIPVARRPIFTGYVEDDLLPDLYRAADLFAYPSLYEGFGLPVLEAMACGTPVLTSNLSSLPEVAGDACLLVDPHDEAAIAEGLRRMLADADLRAELGARGAARSHLFSWDRTAELTWSAYESVLGGDGR